MPAATAALPATPTAGSYIYDSQLHPAQPLTTASERGPPKTSYDFNTGDYAVDRWSHGRFPASRGVVVWVYDTQARAHGDARALSVLTRSAVAAKTVPGYGVGATPKRIPGPWTISDLKQGAFGRPPRSLGRPDLHHADQTPGSGIHEVSPGMHRGNTSLHPNRQNQGVTDEMRMQDRQLHLWYRSQEMSGWDTLGPSYYYDNWP